VREAVVVNRERVRDKGHDKLKASYTSSVRLHTERVRDKGQDKCGVADFACALRKRA
jgi:hypothetical protein